MVLFVLDCINKEQWRQKVAKKWSNGATSVGRVFRGTETSTALKQYVLFAGRVGTRKAFVRLETVVSFVRRSVIKGISVQRGQGLSVSQLVNLIVVNQLAELGSVKSVS